MGRWSYQRQEVKGGEGEVRRNGRASVSSRVEGF